MAAMYCRLWAAGEDEDKVSWLVGWGSEIENEILKQYYSFAVDVFFFFPHWFFCLWNLHLNSVWDPIRFLHLFEAVIYSRRTRGRPTQEWDLYLTPLYKLIFVVCVRESVMTHRIGYNKNRSTISVCQSVFSDGAKTLQNFGHLKRKKSNFFGHDCQ